MGRQMAVSGTSSRMGDEPVAYVRYGRTLVINETQGAPRGVLGNHYRPVAEAVGMDELAKRGTPKKPPSRPITADFGGLPH
jgi:hypothetical protein